MPVLNDDDVPVRLAKTWRERHGRAVIFSDAHFNIVRLELNETGTRVWRSCDGARTVAQICDSVRAEYCDLPDAQVADDVREFLDALVEEWLITSKRQILDYE